MCCSSLQQGYRMESTTLSCGGIPNFYHNSWVNVIGTIHWFYETWNHRVWFFSSFNLYGKLTLEFERPCFSLNLKLLPCDNLIPCFPRDQPVEMWLFHWKWSYLIAITPNLQHYSRQQYSSQPGSVAKKFYLCVYMYMYTHICCACFCIYVRMRTRTLPQCLS